MMMPHAISGWILLCWLTVLACLRGPQVATAQNLPRGTQNTTAVQEAQHEHRYVIGVLAIRGDERAYAEFNQTFSEYLTQQAGQTLEPRASFSMVAMGHNDIRDNIRLGKVDLIFVNPAAFSCVDIEFGAQSLVTLRRAVFVDGETHVIDAFGGVIVARSDRNDIKMVADVRGKSYAAASISGLGSGQAQFRELFKRGISFSHDVTQAVFTGNQNEVVKLVEQGTVDVGFVRDDQLEKMAASGDINASNFKLLDAQQHDYRGGQFPYALTTDLYPEWNLASMASVPLAVKAAVQRALLDMEPGHPAAEGRYHGWAVSHSYASLRNLQEDLGFVRRGGSGELECVWGDSVFEAIVCPAGSFKGSEASVLAGCHRAARECPSGAACVCQPCRRGFAVEVLPGSASVEVGEALQGCQRMDVCESVEQVQPSVWRLHDRLGRRELEVQLTLRSSVAHAIEGAEQQEGGSGEASAVFVAQPRAGAEGEYQVELPGRQEVGLHIVELRVDGAHLDVSPLVLQVLPRDCERDFPGARREPDEAGECVCASTTAFIGGSCVRLSVLLAVVLGVALGGGAVLFSLLFGTRGRKEPEEREVGERIRKLRGMLRIQRKDGFRVAGEWGHFGDSVYIGARKLDNLARLTLLLDFDLRQVDMLSQLLRDGPEHDAASSAGLDDTNKARSTIDPAQSLVAGLDGEGEVCMRGETDQYLALRHLLLEVSKRILEPPQGAEEMALTIGDWLTWARTSSVVDRYDFFQNKIAKLRIWDDPYSFLCLKGVAQMYMDDLHNRCDELFSLMRAEEGGERLSSLAFNGDEARCRQDHRDVQAIPQVASLYKEVQYLRSPPAAAGSPIGSEDSHRRRTPGPEDSVSNRSAPPAGSHPTQRRGSWSEQWFIVSSDLVTLGEAPARHALAGVESQSFRVRQQWKVNSNMFDLDASTQATGGRGSQQPVQRWCWRSRGKGEAEEARGGSLESLRRLHHGLSERVKRKDKLSVLASAGVGYEEPYAKHLVNRALLLNSDFQAKVGCLFGREGLCGLEPAPTVHAGPVKTKQRMMEKVAQYFEDLPARGAGPAPCLPLAAMILDPVRASVVCQTPLQVLQCTQWLLEHGKDHDMPVVRLKNKFAAQDSAEYDGYRDIMVCCLFHGPLGLNIIGEIQFLEKRMHALKVKMHRLYKVKRATAANRI